MAAYALSAHEAGLAGLMIEDNGLVAAVAARHLAASAADALLLVELGVADGVAVGYFPSRFMYAFALFGFSFISSRTSFCSFCCFGWALAGVAGVCVLTSWAETTAVRRMERLTF